MNAIILAAGLGSRFKDVTKTTHKALLPINGIPNIENTIIALKSFGINEIYIVTGYLSHQFDYLEKKYNVVLKYNEKYATYNNIYSFYQTLDELGDSFVIDADVVVLNKSIFQKLNNSSYFTILRNKTENTEWIPIVDSDGIVKEMSVSNEHKPSMLGISYWTKEDAQKIKDKFDLFIKLEILENPKYYWDNIPISMLDELNIKTILVDFKDAAEMDNMQDYEDILKTNHEF